MVSYSPKNVAFASLRQFGPAVRAPPTKRPLDSPA